MSKKTSNNQISSVGSLDYWRDQLERYPIDTRKLLLQVLNDWHKERIQWERIARRVVEDCENHKKEERVVNGTDKLYDWVKKNYDRLTNPVYNEPR